MSGNSLTLDRRLARRALRAAAAIVALTVVAGGQASMSPAAGPGGNLGAADRAAKPGDDQPTADRHASSKQHITQLIRQLGHPRYTARRAAATELRQIGAEAYDLLHEATDDSDPEIAASASYLLQEITIRWTSPDDSALARQLLANYGDQPEEQRLPRIQALASLPDGEGTAGLCRIARFERSDLLSREAALEVIRPDRRQEARTRVAAGEGEEDAEENEPATDTGPAKAGDTPPSAVPDVIERELGKSTRTAAHWLRQYRAQLRDPAASLADWPALIDQEQQLLEQGSSDTNPSIVVGLMWNLAEVHRRLGHNDQLLVVVDRMVALDLNDTEGTTVRLLQWFVDEQSWDAMDAFLDKYQDRLARAKRSLYVAALARAKQGKNNLAETLAQKAASLRSQEALESVDIAYDLARQEQYDWSVREYRTVIDGQQLDSHESILARVLLSAMLHDHQRYEEAAEVLDPLIQAINSEEGNVGQLYQQIQNFHSRSGRLDLPEREALITRYHFYRACHFEKQQDWQKQRAELELAIGHDETDADVVIAMHRLPDADDAWREATRQRILNLSNRFQQDIDETPNMANAYNQWAWLVSNTEGDFQKAIRYSRRSLELMPNEASLLDTLGRCYYAAGDYANAVKYQRRAVARQSNLRVMHRQLALFEKALAEQQQKESKDQGAGKSD